MKIEYKVADILNETEGLIIHGCNTRGAYGSGLAGQIRRRFPQVYEEFKHNIPSPDLLGTLQIVEIIDQLFIGNGFTQLNYGNDGKRYASPEAIDKVLDQALRFCTAQHIDLKLPQIGCGLGGLSWEDEVLPILERHNLFYSNYHDITGFRVPQITIFTLT